MVINPLELIFNDIIRTVFILRSKLNEYFNYFNLGISILLSILSNALRMSIRGIVSFIRKNIKINIVAAFAIKNIILSLFVVANKSE
jgi:hypothetical protein